MGFFGFGVSFGSPAVFTVLTGIYRPFSGTSGRFHGSASGIKKRFSSAFPFPVVSSAIILSRIRIPDDSFRFLPSRAALPGNRRSLPSDPALAVIFVGRCGPCGSDGAAGLNHSDGFGILLIPASHSDGFHGFSASRLSVRLFPRRKVSRVLRVAGFGRGLNHGTRVDGISAAR